jgi:hypothetical protein
VKRAARSTVRKATRRSPVRRARRTRRREARVAYIAPMANAA